MFFGQKIKEKGFTLIEILVVLFIIAILSTLIFANYKDGQDNIKLIMVANYLAQDIRRMQEKAMAAEEFKGSVPQGGFGIYFRTVPPSGEFPYISFADVNLNKLSDAGINCSSGSECIGTVDLKKEGIKIEEMKAPDVQNHLNIIFIPPDPEIFFVGKNDDGSANILTSPQATIKLCLKDAQDNCTSKNKTITVYKTGLITVQ